MSAPITTYIHGADPISQAGVVSQLRGRPEVRIVEEARLDQATVAIVVTETIDESATRILHGLRRGDLPHLIVVATAIDDAGLVTAAESGVAGLIRRLDATPENLVRVITRVNSGEGEVPGDMLGRLMTQLGRLQRQVLTPRGLTFTGLTPREVQVLRLVADGHDTSEIAQELCYSERTVKNVLHDLTTRLQLRNRSHAVAYALREGLI
ncbi:response regulator transcription factor [Ornithinimicrobium ciconiae]|uniref:Response regulator transcription factor n=1 Tax=Ornithinimicrobium ciconiae TaxID=2594265 RepID=A0A516GES3_9MICO|nr:response regulator transcription factor [Ornithinimicrobium ciconiae]QDO90011.1 response regulator transcription factor [Ornithinimicrobium ciconiae]